MFRHRAYTKLNFQSIVGSLNKTSINLDVSSFYGKSCRPKFGGLVHVGFHAKLETILLTGKKEESLDFPSVGSDVKSSYDQSNTFQQAYDILNLTTYFVWYIQN